MASRKTSPGRERIDPDRHQHRCSVSKPNNVQQALGGALSLEAQQWIVKTSSTATKSSTVRRRCLDIASGPSRKHQQWLMWCFATPSTPVMFKDEREPQQEDGTTSRNHQVQQMCMAKTACDEQCPQQVVPRGSCRAKGLGQYFQHLSARGRCPNP